MFHVLEKIPSLLHYFWLRELQQGESGAHPAQGLAQKCAQGHRAEREEKTRLAFPALSAPPGGETSETKVAQSLKATPAWKEQGISHLCAG